ncbi:hypothetical protein A2662_02745 [Candidatus Giovannonibacteria bacterium RIFCSPHIGHO2_01_FULL_45_33]|nr:MAG: hypothetical protein A2662_02745 [Candidatus Giovannonibacteria bacterium RIFCSPHIGHO2_01_FULL_45_33]
MNKEKMFEQKAQEILKYLKSNIRYGNYIPRPFFLEFTGSPSAGKSTTITELDKFLRREGFRVLPPQEGAEQVRHIERDTPLYNIATCDYARKILIDESHGHKYDVVIFDRGIFDGYCWMEYWQEKNKLTVQDKEIYQKFFLSEFWVNNIDAAYFMVCDPKIAMEREQRIALTKKLGETTNPKNVEILVNRYKKAYDVLSPTHKQLRLLDTTKMEEKKMVEMIAEQVLNVLQEKAKSGR